jgi:signal transduction histidine kinase
MLGLGLVVAIIALLLAGTFKGLTSYIATMKTMDSKLSELAEAYRLREAIQKLETQPEQKSDEIYGDAEEYDDLIRKAQAAEQVLTSYEEILHDTLSRNRDPDKGVQEQFIVRQLHKRFSEFREALRQVRDSPTAVAGGKTIPLHEQPGVLKAIKSHDGTSLAEASDDLLNRIREQLSDRIFGAKYDYGISVKIVLATSIGGVLLLTVILRFFYTWVFHPIRDVERGAGRVAQGDFEHRIEVHSGDEMEDLAEAFNNMTQRLREMYRDLERQVNERSRQLVRSERLAGIGFLAAGVAHEINNPLASIAFCSEALDARLAEILDSQGRGLGLRGQGPPATIQAKLDGQRDTIQKYLKMIQEEAFRCKEITERLLEFSRSSERRREPTDLAELVQSVLDMAQHLQNRKGKQVVFQPASSVVLPINPQEIKSVVLNLVVNALDSMEDGGTLTVGLRQDLEMAELTFSDNGCGMPPEVLENIFEPFFTRSRTGKGTGLGLTISHRIITQHGGEIEAASAGPNAGSTFTVRLPLHPPDEQVNREADEGTEPRSFRRREAA